MRVTAPASRRSRGDGAGVGAAGGVGREHQGELARGVAQQQGVLLGQRRLAARAQGDDAPATSSPQAIGAATSESTPWRSRCGSRSVESA